MGHNSLPSDVYKELCEAFGCFAKAATEVRVPVGELGVIKLIVCKNCKSKFTDCEFVLKERSGIDNGTDPADTFYPKNFTDWADFWRYVIGVNVIPADTRKKVTYEKWSDWQDKPISEELHNEWKAQNAFSKGMAIIVGKVWHREDKKELYFTFIDTDNLKAIESICTRNGKTITLHLG